MLLHSLQQQSLPDVLLQVVSLIWRRFRKLMLGLTALACYFASPADVFAQKGGATPQEPRQWALLIGVEKYQHASPLQYTVNDVTQIARTLLERGGVAKERILEITDAAKDPRYQPLKSNLETEIPLWLKQVPANDQILVYFSGHGVRDKEGNLYLAPIDCDPDDLASTGISVGWFRDQIAACPAAFKLLILDACHAGSEKGAQKEGAFTDKESEGTLGGLEKGAQKERAFTDKELENTFGGLKKVVTLTSSSADENSIIWDDMEQSLFSYWLNQGLKGHADMNNNNGAVDIHELYEYVCERVQHTADTRFGRNQNPKRIVRTGTDGVPVILRLQPQTLKQVLADIGEQVAATMKEYQCSAVGVFEFTDGSGEEELLGASFGPLGRYCSDEVESWLWRHKISVVDRQRMMDAMREKQFSIRDLGKAVAVKELAAKVDGMPVIVKGTILNRSGREIKLRCKLVQVESGELRWSAGGTALLNEHEWGMLGRSVMIRPEDRIGPAPAPGQNLPAQAPQFASEQFIERLDQLSQGPDSHPLHNPNFRFRVWVKAGSLDAKGQFQGVERPLEFRGNNAYLPVRKDEVLQIWVHNNSGQLALMRLLVDGLNTLPEIIANTAIANANPMEPPSPAPWMTRSQSDVMVDGKPKGVITCEWGAHVNLGEARPWVLDPKDEKLKGGQPTWVIDGFVTKTGEDGELRRFIVVDAEQPLAGRQQFTDQLGMITVAFYAPAGIGRGPVGIAPGPLMKQNLKEKKAPQWAISWGSSTSATSMLTRWPMRASRAKLETDGVAKSVQRLLSEKQQ